MPQVPSNSSSKTSAIAPRFQFDHGKLAILAKQVPPQLQLLRLRLRNSRVHPLELAIAYEIVDPATGKQTQKGDQPALALRLRDAGAPKMNREKCCKWTFDAEFVLQQPEQQQNDDDTVAQQQHESAAPAVVFVRLCVKLRQTNSSTMASRPPHDTFHALLQQFCVHSAWVNDGTTLILPIQSNSMQLSLAPPATDKKMSPQEAAPIFGSNTNKCARLFSISPSEVPEGEAQVIAIHEDYGETMGSHIWDASILLSFAFLHATASQFAQEDDREAARHGGMLELGAGCGLFAAVYALRCFKNRCEKTTTMVLTERTESLALLTSNLHHNCSSSSQRSSVVMPLTWGEPLGSTLCPDEIARVDTIFASDVLYHWASHEALLTTIEAILQASRGLSSVIIAHKHCGKATSTALESVLQRGHDSDCSSSFKPKAASPMASSNNGSENGCQWANWDVARLATLGSVDLLQLTRRR
ncbi:Nicotinamide n-methyltransferase, partial [Globisporangium splendens]